MFQSILPDFKLVDFLVDISVIYDNTQLVLNEPIYILTYS